MKLYVIILFVDYERLCEKIEKSVSENVNDFLKFKKK